MKKLLLLIGLCLLAYTCSKGEDNSPIAPIKHTISVSATDGGSVNTSGGEFIENSSVSIVATPEQGYEFSGWTGTSLTGSSITIKVISNQTITANFVRSIYTLTIDTVGSGEVSQQIVNSARETTEYESGKTIRLSATPQSDFLFYDWEYLNNNQSDNSYENPIEVIMDQSKVVTATFEEKLLLINPDNADKNNTVGKWKIRKKRPGSRRSTLARLVDCEINEIILRTDNSFTIITETSTITGQYTIDSETSISLNQGETNIGGLTGIILTENYISFNIDLAGVCNEQLEADKDPTYDEATDPIAPSNTGSSTLTSKPCTIETELTSDNVNQTIRIGESIQDILIAVTVGSTCTETLSVSSSNLPQGLSVSLDNDQITISGIPSSNSVGTFDYDIMLSTASPTIIVNGQIIVEQITTQTNLNQGGGGTDTSTTTSTTTTNTTTDTSTSTNNGTTTPTTSSDTTNTGTTTSSTTTNTTDTNISPSTGTTSSTVAGENNTGTTITTNTGTTTSNTSTDTTDPSTGTNSVITGTPTLTNSSQESKSFNIQVLLFQNNSSDYKVLLLEDRFGGLNGDADPELDFYVGDSISFEVDTPGHPFYLKTVQGTGTNDLISGVTNNGATNGTVSWTPTTAGTYYYQCSLHNGMYGTITVN